MAAQFNSIFGQVITTCISWFESMLKASGYVPFYLAAIFLFFIFKFLLRPIFGLTSLLGSDRARKQTKEGSHE